MSALRRLLLVVVLAVAAPAAVVAAVAGAGPAGAQAGEHIAAYDVDLVVDQRGVLSVTEVITYDFGASPRHGIQREIPTKLHYDSRYDRIYRLRDVTVTADPGTPDRVQRKTSGGTTTLRIGDPDREITGRHTYTIRYRVEGALNHFADHDELYWNGIGTEWTVPMDRARVRLAMPVAIQRTACFAGAAGSTLPCTTSTPGEPGTGDTWVFGPQPLGSSEGLTVVAGIPTGVVPTPRPILEERWSLGRAFDRSPAKVGAAAGLFALVLAGVGWLLWRTGRDRRFAGSPVDVALGNESGSDQRLGLFENRDVPVEFVPPDHVRPGQVGTLVDEVANPLDVTATIVDLAVRGFLRIEEIPKRGWFGKPDWKLVQTKTWEDGGLLEYERTLLRHLFAGSREVELSDLRNTFAAKLKDVQNDLYDDAVARGWFLRRPDRVRQLWAVAGIAVVVAGVGLTILGATGTRHFGLVPIPIVIGGLVLLVASHWMPSRTARGTATLRRALGFRRFIEDSEKDRAQFAERANLFSEYLPYAVVFGATDKWARAFAGLDDQLPDTSTWYVGTHPFTMASFGEAMDGFATTAAGTIASTPSGSGSSGFGGGGGAGGGGGGGGGGSW